MGSSTARDKDLFDQFITIYNQFDAYMRRQAAIDKQADHSYLIQQTARTNRLISRYEQELKTFAQLRNVLAHSPFMAIAHPMATPDPVIIERYQQILDAVINPPTALSIAVPGAQIYTTTPDSNALEVMRIMNEKTFTHIPVVADDQMVGIFSENTILAYLAHHGDSIVTTDLLISEFADFIGLDKHPGEIYAFVSRKAQLADIYSIFNGAIKVRKRVGVVFVTEHGKPSEKLLGLITAWDLASPEFVV